MCGRQRSILKLSPYFGLETNSCMLPNRGGQVGRNLRGNTSWHHLKGKYKSTTISEGNKSQSPGGNTTLPHLRGKDKSITISGGNISWPQSEAGEYKLVTISGGKTSQPQSHGGNISQPQSQWVYKLTLISGGIQASHNIRGKIKFS